MRDKDGSLAAVFARGAGDVGALLGEASEARGAEALAEAIVGYPGGWGLWLPNVLERASPELAGATLRAISERGGATAAWMIPIRLLADAAGDVDAYRATFTAEAMRGGAAAAAVARRLLAAGRTEEAGRVLEAAAPGGRGRAGEPDFDWESLWIDWLEQTGQAAAAQASRWASFERTLSAERARAFTRRLPEFEDVEAEGRAFELAARAPDFARGLAFLMAWPALPEAARMIEARAGEAGRLEPEQAELWAGRLRARQPRAAALLLRAGAATALVRRDKATGERLRAEAEAIEAK
jgi:hypothetical protein